MSIASNRRYLLIGSGAAGIAAAEAIRQQDPSGLVMMATADPQGYYSRPGLAYYLTGELPENMLFPMKPQDFKHLNINLINQSVKSISPQEHRCQLMDGRQVQYDRLLLATGAVAAPLKMPGSTLEGVVKLDSLADANHILQLARKGRTAVVVGGGITAREIVMPGCAGCKNYYLLRGTTTGTTCWMRVAHCRRSASAGSGYIYYGNRRTNRDIHIQREFSQGYRVASVTTDGQVIRCDIVVIHRTARGWESSGRHRPHTGG
jgi:thioredoxin reductase